MSDKKNSKKRPIKFKNVEGVEYQLLMKPPHHSYNALGLADSPDSKKPKIWVDPRLKEKKMIAVLIEEAFHSHFFEVSEKQARHFARILTKLIYFLGWRKVE